MTAAKLTEAQWQKRVVEIATLHGWRWCHLRPAQVRNGRWATPQGGHPGFPDLVLARAGEVIVAELKTDTGRMRPGQPEWLEQLGPHGRLWRPAQWDDVHNELRRPA